MVDSEFYKLAIDIDLKGYPEIAKTFLEFYGKDEELDRAMVEVMHRLKGDSKNGHL